MSDTKRDQDPAPPIEQTSVVVVEEAGTAPAGVAAAGAVPAPPAGRGSSLTDLLANYGVFLFLVLLSVGFSIAQPDQFPTTENLRVLLGDNAVPGLLALAVVIPLAAGEFDLSVGATLGFTSILTAQLTIHGTPVGLAILLAVLVGAVVGAVNAVLVVGIGVNAFIATLATATVLSGLNLLVTGGRTLFEGIPDGLKEIANSKILGIDLTVYYFLIGALVLWYLLEHTPFGRLLRATGMGREAARLTGVRTSSFLAGSFVIAGAIAGLCGALQLARVGSATASMGPEFLLPAYAAAFLGSTTIKRGQFNIWGAVVGTFLLAVGITGLTFAGAPFWVPNVFNGGALIIAVSVAVLVGRRAGDTT
ncbi:ABC transporter permease [Streptomyces sp. NPDC048278]|uniref:ABC transporter permease n=1 Tax=Streptomyces sp. NPDC048278 TaxID=3155809 RepID=UPI00343F02F8